MKHTKDRGIVLSRTDFAERDRILVVLGKTHGKVTLIAKSVRSSKSKLAGGIELFSESDIQYVAGKSSMHTLTGARLHKHFGQLSEDIDHTILAYDFLKLIHKITEDGHGQEYYPLLSAGLNGLNDKAANEYTLKAWFGVKVLEASGRLPNLRSDTRGQRLEQAESYNYDFDHHCFVPVSGGRYQVENIKILRVLAGAKKPLTVNASNEILKNTAQLVDELIRLGLY